MELLTIEEVAKTLRLTPYTVRKFLRDKKLKGFKLGKEWRIRKDELEQFLTKQGGGSDL